MAGAVNQNNDAGAGVPTLTAILAALSPIFLLILAGWLIRTFAGFEDSFWSATETLVFWLFLPALLFMTTSGADLDDVRIGPLALALLAAIFLTAAMALLMRPWLKVPDAGFSSVFQGAIRTNSYVALAAASALYGKAGLAVTGIVVLVVITTVNVLSVLALARYGARTGGALLALKGVCGNPLIIACLAGFAIGSLDLAPGGFVFDTIEILSRAALPLGLLCVGAGLEVADLSRNLRLSLATSTLKLVLMPGATAGFCWMLGIEGVTARTAVLFNAVPISASTYVLARQMGGDARLASALITFTTLAAAITMPIVLALLT